MLVISAVTVAVGQAIFAIGVSFGSFIVAVIARAVLGIATQSLDIAQAICLIKWFSGKELSMSIGFKITTALLSIALDANTQPGIVELSHSLDLAVWIAFLFCVLSLISMYFVIHIDRRRDKLLGSESLETFTQHEKFKCSDIKKFRFLYWLLVVEIFLVCWSIIPFDSISSRYYQKRFGYTSTEAGSISSIPFVMSIILTPVWGIMVDRIGKRGIMLIIGPGIMCLFHVLLLLSPDSYQPVYP